MATDVITKSTYSLPSNRYNDCISLFNRSAVTLITLTFIRTQKPQGGKTACIPQDFSATIWRQSIKPEKTNKHSFPVSILYKSTAGRYRPVRVADGLITARCRFIKNASWVAVKTVNLKGITKMLLHYALWFIQRGDLLYVFPCVILFLCFLVLLVLRLPRLGKRELILVLFVRLFDLCLFGFVGFLFLLGSGKGCGL